MVACMYNHKDLVNMYFNREIGTSKMSSAHAPPTPSHNLDSIPNCYTQRKGVVSGLQPLCTRRVQFIG